MKNTIEYKRFVWQLNNIIKLNEWNDKIIFLCIGTNRIVGDFLGPCVGSILYKTLSVYPSVDVIGNNENLVTYNNVEKVVNHINNLYQNKLIIVIDAALSEEKNIGKIFVQNRGLKYAESLKKSNNIIGDFSIKAVVGKNTNNSIENFKNLSKLAIGSVLKMSYIVSSGITEVMYKKENNGKNIHI